MSARGSRKGSAGGASGGGGKKKVATYADFSRMNQASSAAAGIIDVLRAELATLEGDIKADRAGCREYEIQLERLAVEREEALERLEKNRTWAAKFDKEIGPFERKYETLTIDIKDLYNNAADQHLKGIELLIREFEYHPQFKRQGDKFTAVPFRPKRA
mmetsp:Transcript_14202/g.49396  ORF Transcript_14202/g.49396 Transcript_14202/m.49396 type:complete len:159 (-) Transcript_14202:71-547(-)